MLVFREFLVISTVERQARSLVGKPTRRIVATLGKPDKVLDAVAFNSEERDNISSSFKPRSIPKGTGSVYVYNYMPTIIVVFVDEGIVKDVYIGRS
jgi:hypothetical protein